MKEMKGAAIDGLYQNWTYQSVSFVSWTWAAAALNCALLPLLITLTQATSVLPLAALNSSLLYYVM